MSCLRHPGARSLLALPLVLALAAALPARAYASCFCILRLPPAVRSTETGLTDDKAYNPATAVVLLRDGTRTIMTIEAAYRGPRTELSLVVPVPSAIARSDVRTISGTHFRRLDRATSPRVQHVWPQCRPLRRRVGARTVAMAEGAGGGGFEPPEEPEALGIEIEDEWELDEYDVTVLSASQSTGLLTFLRRRNLDLPDEASRALRAYIETGHRFVLLQADPSRAHEVGGDMVLSPIQLDFEAESLSVPVRLGTLNSPGEQELLLYVLSTEGRYEVANRENVVMPTDLRVRHDYEGGLGRLYAGLLHEVFRRHPGAALTEYARPFGRSLHAVQLRPFGLFRLTREEDRRSWAAMRRWTLTRLRHRYGSDLDDDLRLRVATDQLRHTRRWPTRELRRMLRSWAGGRDDFHTRFVAVQPGGCPSRARRRAANRQWATSSELWAGGDLVWPGEALLDDIEALNIEAGSSAPEGWGAPPPPPPPRPPEAAAGAAADPAPPPPAEPPAPEAPPERNDGEATEPGSFWGCGVERRGTTSWPPGGLGVLAVAFLALVLRRRRRGGG